MLSMTKFLFFDYREVESINGFRRVLEQPKKHAGNPLFIADQPWENGNMQLYGSVVKAPGRPFQLWYSVIHPPFTIYLAYAESDDGIAWRKPLFEIFEFEGQKTNIIFTDEPHGPAIIYDDADPREDWKYKMLCGASPSRAICAYRSADGIHWTPVRPYPVIPTNPDCPMAFYRAQDGRYVALHRLAGFGRRVFRSESWDFLYWSGEPRMIMEPDAGDPTQVQFYGMGATTYGGYEIGTLWMFHTDPTDMAGGKSKGYQESELTYARGGYCWHRAAQGTPFIPHGDVDSWEQGNLQCASAPVFLDDEIRYYYAGSTMLHQRRWELEPQTAGLGMASMKPDRFIALVADDLAELLTCGFSPQSPHLFINARTERDGWIKVELTAMDGSPIPGFSADDCHPITGDDIAIPVSWKSGAEWPVGQAVRVHVQAKRASLYSIFSCPPECARAYREF
jgi:hypothetical protein